MCPQLGSPERVYEVPRDSSGTPTPFVAMEGASGIQRYSDNAAARAAVPRLELSAPSEPSTPEARNGIHQNIVSNATRLVSDINSSNKLSEHALRAVAESTLRAFSAFQWSGTGISQHKDWQSIVPERRKVVSPDIGRDGFISVTPRDWENCFNTVQNQRDQLNRKWGNCSEQAASLAHVIYGMINSPNDRSAAGLQVRQSYGSAHSWTEVQYPNGQVVVYDPWERQVGDLRDMPESYRSNVNHTRWYGRN